MAVWNGRGIRIGYPIPSSPTDSSLETETEVPDSANEAIYTNLALKIAPTIGKTPSKETKTTAKTSYNQLAAKFTKPTERQLPRHMPAGAGNKRIPYDRQFVDAPEDTIDTDGDAELDFN